MFEELISKDWVGEDVLRLCLKWIVGKMIEGEDVPDGSCFA